MNIKKIGLTALAGSLAMVSANAVELSVAGKTEVTYMSKDIASTGNPYGMGNALTFSGSGDVNGMTATYTSVIQDSGGLNTTTSEVFASSSLMLDMGDMGTVGFDQGVGEFGAGTIDDKMPYAYEEIWTYVGSGTATTAAIGGKNKNVLGYKNTAMGASVSIEIDPGQKASSGASGDGGATGAASTSGGYNFAITGSPYAGVNAGIGLGEESQESLVNTQDSTYTTGFVTYAVEGATVGYQLSEARGGSTGTVAQDAEFYGISYSVNEDFAISYNVVNTDYYSKGAGQETTKGYGASYTMGSAAIRMMSAKIDNKAGDKLAQDETITELSLLLAF